MNFLLSLLLKLLPEKHVFFTYFESSNHLFASASDEILLQVYHNYKVLTFLKIPNKFKIFNKIL